jgi:hypothetical protein
MQEGRHRPHAGGRAGDSVSGASPWGDRSTVRAAVAAAAGNQDRTTGRRSLSNEARDSRPWPKSAYRIKALQEKAGRGERFQ